MPILRLTPNNAFGGRECCQVIAEERDSRRE
jgi:hypothetical protein